MADEAIRTGRIELVDSEGETAIVLRADSDEHGMVALFVEARGEHRSLMTISIDEPGGSPFLRMSDGDDGAHAAISFHEGRAFLTLENSNGSRELYTPLPVPDAEPDFGTTPGDDILPIFVADLSGDEIVFHSHEGTGFLMGKHVMVTCWHCVQAEVPEGWAYVALRPDDKGDIEWFRMVNIEQDPNGTDLATAQITAEPNMRLHIAAENPMMSEEVWSYGYPLTDVARQPELDYKTFRPNPRWMQSYILRIFDHDQPHFGNTPSYELDMPSLAGMSGAPIVRRGTREVIGVLYGRKDAEQIEEWGSRDPETGERLTPQVVRMAYFAVAHHADTLRDLRGAATNGRPLGEFLGH